MARDHRPFAFRVEDRRENRREREADEQRAADIKLNVYLTAMQKIILFQKQKKVEQIQK